MLSPLKMEEAAVQVLHKCVPCVGCHLVAAGVLCILEGKSNKPPSQQHRTRFHLSSEACRWKRLSLLLLLLSMNA